MLDERLIVLIRNWRNIKRCFFLSFPFLFPPLLSSSLHFSPLLSSTLLYSPFLSSPLLSFPFYLNPILPFFSFFSLPFLSLLFYFLLKFPPPCSPYLSFSFHSIPFLSFHHLIFMFHNQLSLPLLFLLTNTPTTPSPIPVTVLIQPPCPSTPYFIYYICFTHLRQRTVQSFKLGLTVIFKKFLHHFSHSLITPDITKTNQLSYQEFTYNYLCNTLDQYTSNSRF